MLRWNCAVLALVAACGSLSPHTQEAAGPRDRQIAWQRTLADAEALAKVTGRPLLLALNMDGESASDRIWHENYRDPGFVELTRRCVCVAASVFRHNANDYDQRGRRIECPRLSGLTCGEHMALEPQLFERYFTDGERVAPRHALILPDGKVAFDLSLSFDLMDIDRALAAATAEVEPWWQAPGSSWAELAARRDAWGREALEAAIARCDGAPALGEALAAIGQHGDAGSLPALRLVLGRLPDAPFLGLRDAAERLGLVAELRALARERAQRLGAVLGSTQRPADYGLLVRASASGADLRTRTWLCGEAATSNTSEVSWQAIEDLSVSGPAGTSESHAVVDRAVTSLPAGFAEAVCIRELLDAGARCVEGVASLPLPGVERRELATAEVLRERLRLLDERIAQDRDDIEVLAELGVASLDLGRVDLETGGSTALLLFEDAARYLDRALAGAPDRYEWWLERARTAYYLQRFAEQRQCGVEALAVAGFSWPPAAEHRTAMLRDARAIEAARWIGDADARLLAASETGEPVATVGRMRSALLALGLPAVSAYGSGRDQVGFASFVESLGLVREEMAILLMALERSPGSPEVRQALSTALWLGGRWASLPALTELALHPTATAAGEWWAGYARLQVAEELRRREQVRAAVEHYAAAHELFARSAAANPAFAQSVQSYQALSWLGRGLAWAQGAEADRVASASCLVTAVGMGGELGGLRDGLGYDAVDLVDKVLEWRSGGPSPVAPEQLLDELLAAARETPFWATAISGTALREALRADGRNPERVLSDTVDASGQPMRAPVGLPTELGDRYLAAAVAAGKRAVQMATATDEDRQVYAQALTIQAERRLVREQAGGVRELLQLAADTLGVELGEPAGGASELHQLRALAAPLRERLGPARPRQRDGR